MQVLEKPQEAVCEGWGVRWLKGLVRKAISLFHQYLVYKLNYNKLDK